jgi:nucleoside phosphorylase
MSIKHELQIEDRIQTTSFKLYKSPINCNCIRSKMYNHSKKSKTLKKLFVGAMERELEPIIEWLGAKKKQMVLGKYPLYKGTQDSYILQTFVGSTNAAIALATTLNTLSPNVVFKIGCAGSISARIHKGEIVLPLGYFHSNAWTTLTKNSEATSDAASWTSLFGEGDCKVNERNRGDIPYHFKSVNLPSFRSSKLKTAYVGSSDIWYFDKKTLNNVKGTLAPKPADNCILDMESYTLAQTCFIANIPFVGIYVISDNSIFSNELYDPHGIKSLINRAIPLLKTLFTTSKFEH